jgi:UDP-N-acetylglucosamine 4,6-dehydratase (inverting)
MINNNPIPSTSILITGGTGSFGRAFVRTVLNTVPNLSRLVVFSRDELKQYDMQQEFPQTEFPALRFFLGDVRDKNRLNRAMEGIDTVVHAAALKQVPAAEYNPFEFIQTNVIGAQNVIDACLDNGVKRVVALSTDKAASPINLYGATKLCSDKLFMAANNFKGNRDLRFSIVRYGNVMGSRGSVIPFFLQQAKTGILPITNPVMTRFNISISDGVDLVFHALSNAFGGEIFVPKIPSYRIQDVANAIGPNCVHKIIGSREGEKLHEEMITTNDSVNTLDIGKYFVILGAMQRVVKLKYINEIGASEVSSDFSYNSLDNTIFLSIQDIRDLIREQIDTEFSPV